MAGVSDCGVCLPFYYISGERIASEWGHPPSKFTKRFASYDEDSLTLAVDAALECEADTPDVLFFASTTPPYLEKQGASIIAAALDLPQTTRTLDVTGSLRSATSALLIGLDLVKAGSASAVLVTSGDCRMFEPGAPGEVAFGDGAAATLIKNDENIAEFVDSCSLTSDLMHSWRKSTDRFVKTGDVRFSQKLGYEKIITEAVKELLEKVGLKPSDVAKVVLPLPEIRPIRNIFKNCGFELKTHWHDPLTGFTGFTGTPHPLLLFASALENAEKGELILLCGYGDGVDVALFKVTEQVEEFKKRRPVKRALKRRREIKTYTRYLDFRNHLRRWDEYLEDAFTSTILLNRESVHNLRLHAKKCGECGAVLTLPLPVCPHCRNDENFSDFKLSRKGKVFTYSQEYYVPTPAPPISLCSIDLEGGGRLLTQMTDCEPDEVRIGMEVELTFRRMHQAGGMFHYWWKARPQEGEQG